MKIKEILLAPISGSNPVEVREILKKTKLHEFKSLLDIIIENLIAIKFLKYYEDNNLTDLFPNEFLHTLKTHRTRLKIQSLQVVKETKKLNEMLKKLNIKHAFIKGVAISHIFYEKFDERSMADIDIILEKQDVISFYKLLLESEYTHIPNNSIALDEENLDIFLSSNHAAPQIRSKTGVCIDLHFKPFKNDNSSLISKYIFERTSQQNFYGETISFPSREVVLIHSILNSYKNNGLKNFLKVFYDLDSSLNDRALNLKKLLEDAESMSNKHIIIFALRCFFSFQNLTNKSIKYKHSIYKDVEKIHYMAVEIAASPKHMHNKNITHILINQPNILTKALSLMQRIFLSKKGIKNKFLLNELSLKGYFYYFFYNLFTVFKNNIAQLPKTLKNLITPNNGIIMEQKVLKYIDRLK